MEDTSILCLPDEIIEYILESSVLSIEDVVNFRKTCSYFNELLANGQSLWKNKIFSTWNFLKDEFASKNDIHDWYGQCKHIYETRNFVHSSIKSMSNKYSWRNMSVSGCDLEHFMEKCQENDGLACHYVMHFLLKIIHKPITCSDTTPCEELVNLTTQYYSKIVYDYILQQYVLKRTWFKMISSEDLFVPYNVFTFGYKWLYTRKQIGLTFLNGYIDVLFNQVTQKIPADHPFFSISPDTKNKWRHTMLTDNQYDGMHCRLIIQLVSDILVKAQMLQSRNLSYFQLDEVLYHTESYYTLMHIIFETLVHWCGVRLVLKGFRNHQFIYWRENWTANSQRYLVDLRTGNLKISYGRCPSAAAHGPVPEIKEVYNPTELLLNLIPPINETPTEFTRGVMVNAIELSYAVSPETHAYVHSITNMYIVQNRDLGPIVQHMEAMEYGRRPPNSPEMITYLGALRVYQAARNRPQCAINVMKRKAEVKYPIGLVCTHLQFLYTCVLTGWNYECEASAEWQQNMRVDRLALGSKQPFYKVVAEDGSMRYVAQENLDFLREPHRLEVIEDIIGNDFTHFNGYTYVPNKEKIMQYPDDLAHTAFFVSKMHSHKEKTTS